MRLFFFPSLPFFPYLKLAMVKELKDVKIAVIGGSGLYHLEGLEVIEEVYPETVSEYCQKERINKKY